MLLWIILFLDEPHHDLKPIQDAPLFTPPVKVKIPAAYEAERDERKKGTATEPTKYS